MPKITLRSLAVASLLALNHFDLSAAVAADTVQAPQTQLQKVMIRFRQLQDAQTAWSKESEEDLSDEENTAIYQMLFSAAQQLLGEFTAVETEIVSGSSEQNALNVLRLQQANSVILLLNNIATSDVDSELSQMSINMLNQNFKGSFLEGAHRKHLHVDRDQYPRCSKIKHLGRKNCIDLRSPRSCPQNAC